MTKITVYDSGQERHVTTRLMIGTPTTGTIRMEWHLARSGQIIPTNWSQSFLYPGFHDSVITFRYGVADAQNVIVHHTVQNDYEWLLLYEHDMLPPPDAYVRINQYMRDKEVPIVSGLYYTRSRPPEPLVYRGRGNSFFADWQLGEKVWVDGVPTGFLLIHGSILKGMYYESDEYMIGGLAVRRVFDVPVSIALDPENHGVSLSTGTTDLAWCQRIIDEGWFEKTGWPEYQDKEYPFLVDTNLFCAHINPNGEQFPCLQPWEALHRSNIAAVKQLEEAL